jgi:hypothetical protein
MVLPSFTSSNRWMFGSGSALRLQLKKPRPTTQRLPSCTKGNGIGVFVKPARGVSGFHTKLEVDGSQGFRPAFGGAVNVSRSGGRSVCRLAAAAPSRCQSMGGSGTGVIAVETSACRGSSDGATSGTGGFVSSREREAGGGKATFPGSGVGGFRSGHRLMNSNCSASARGGEWMPSASSRNSNTCASSASPMAIARERIAGCKGRRITRQTPGRTSSSLQDRIGSTREGV